MQEIKKLEGSKYEVKITREKEEIGEMRKEAIKALKKNVKMDVFIEMLKFDFLLLGKPGFFPEWFNRNSSRELFKNAVENSNYFNSEKDGYKNGEFEIFMHIFEKKSSVLFIYNKQKKVITEVVNIE